MPIGGNFVDETDELTKGLFCHMVMIEVKQMSSQETTMEFNNGAVNCINKIYEKPIQERNNFPPPKIKVNYNNIQTQVKGYI